MIIEGYLFLFLIEKINCDPSSEPSRRETVQMKGHNKCFCAEMTKNIPNYHQILPLI